MSFSIATPAKEKKLTGSISQKFLHFSFSLKYSITLVLSLPLSCSQPTIKEGFSNLGCSENLKIFSIMHASFFEKLINMFHHFFLFLFGYWSRFGRSGIQ